MPKKGKFPGPWRQESKEFTGLYEVRCMTNRGSTDFNIHAVYKITYRRKTGPKQHQFERMHEDRRTVGLEEVLRNLELTDQQYTLIALTKSGLATFERLFNLYDTFLWRRERKAQEARREAYLKRKAEIAEGRALDGRRKRLANKQFTRVVEV